jgi:hypothetical protein
MAVDEVAEFAEEYNSQLRAMKRPAKEEINALTMVAADYEDNPPFASAVVQVLERCIQEVIPAAFASDGPADLFPVPPLLPRAAPRQPTLQSRPP